MPQIQLQIQFFNNTQNVTFTLGDNNDGYSVNTSPADYQIQQSPASPLAPQQGQSVLAVHYPNPLEQFPPADLLGIIPPTGPVVASVIWTSLDKAVRFGVMAAINYTLPDQELLGQRLPMVWQYMSDQTPNQQPTWILPTQTTPVSIKQLKITMTLTPTISQSGVQIVCSLDKPFG